MVRTLLRLNVANHDVQQEYVTLRAKVELSARQYQLRAANPL